MPPLILDLDASVGPLDRAAEIGLHDWHDALRFGCSMGTLRAFERELLPRLPSRYGTVFMGSGDFHHLSLPLIDHAIAAHGAVARDAVQVIVFDNHPDNMRFPFGVHCGSWVRRVAALPVVAQVHVIGIRSADIAAASAWQNYLRPLYRGKLQYWSVGVDIAWARRVGLGQAVRGFDDCATMLRAFLAYQNALDSPIYLSIDKDVLDPSDAMSNWDQGSMRIGEMTDAIAHLRHRIIASDVTGEISIARYKQWWKRALSAMDHQSEPDADRLREWQRQQHAVNLRLLEAIGGS